MIILPMILGTISVAKNCRISSMACYDASNNLNGRLTKFCTTEMVVSMLDQLLLQHEYFNWGKRWVEWFKPCVWLSTAHLLAILHPTRISYFSIIPLWWYYCYVAQLFSCWSQESDYFEGKRRQVGWNPSQHVLRCTVVAMTHSRMAELIHFN